MSNKRTDLSNVSNRGPRAARGEVKEQLLDAARALFSASDYTSVTMRAIADEAQCDAGLISYYFGSKIGIFRAAMSLPADPIQVILDAFAGGPGAGERVLRETMKLLEESAAAVNFRLYLSTLLSDPHTLDVFAQWVDEELLLPMAQALAGTNRRLRMQIAFGQVLGLMAVRYIYAIEPIASHPREEIAAFVGPRLDVILGYAEASIRPASRFLTPAADRLNSD